MTWSQIQSTEIAVGKPVRSRLIRKYTRNLTACRDRTAGGGHLGATGGATATGGTSTYVTVATMRYWIADADIGPGGAALRLYCRLDNGNSGIGELCAYRFSIGSDHSGNPTVAKASSDKQWLSLAWTPTGNSIVDVDLEVAHNGDGTCTITVLGDRITLVE